MLSCNLYSGAVKNPEHNYLIDEPIIKH